jgi:putative DNA methylase
VIFAQMVNDPGYERSLQRGVNKKEAEQKREALFQIIRDLVKWENTNNETVLAKARAAIWDSWRETCDLNKNHPQAAELFNPEKLPAFHDPFAGGGALPLEAQRLGLESYASDLNPVAVMINKAMIEIPPKFAGRAPVGALPEGNQQTKLPEQWTGAQGLAEDVRRYGHWMREQAFERIGHLYPQMDITTGLPVFPKTSVHSENAVRPELVEGHTVHGSTVRQAHSSPRTVREPQNTATVIAWLWARTVKSPNPAFFHVDVPLYFI